MANVHDVALFFIEIAQEQSKKNLGDPMTNLRLQKLLYFAQGWHCHATDILFLKKNCLSGRMDRL